MRDKGLRVERVVTAGVQLTKEELIEEITKAKNGAMFNYARELPGFLKDVSMRAQDFGKAICGRVDCEIECVGVDLTSTATPVTNVDADVTVRCKVPDCTDETVESTVLFVKSQVGQLGSPSE